MSLTPTRADSAKADKIKPSTRPDDSVVFSAVCRLRLRSGGRVPAQIAVVQHKSSAHETAVVITAQDNVVAPLRIAHALPVTPDFTVSLTQIPPSPSTSFFAQSSKPRIELTLGGETKIELQFHPNEAAQVQTLVKTLRNAVEASDGPSWNTHSWLKFYPVAGTDVAPPEDKDEELERSFGKLETENGSKDKPDEVDELDKDVSDKELDGADDEDDTPSDDFPNPYVKGFDTQDFIRKRLFERQSKWSSKKPVSIRCVTYNVNDRIPPTGTTELAEVLGYGAEDIIVVGIQEADLRYNSMLVTQDDTRAAAWESAILGSLGDRKDEFEKVAVIQFVGVLMVVVARTQVRAEMWMVNTASRGIGLLGIGGNKAGVAVRLKVHDTTLCFVNCHLAAQMNQLERRRYDYQALRTGLTFPAPTHINPATEEYYPANGPYGVEDADVLFWLGDLNYRIELEDKEIIALVEAKDWSTVMTADQLLTDIQDKLSFEGFSEPDIRFKPSFKYVHGSVTLDSKRAPAYTDRVLYRARNTPVFPKKYNSHDLLWSDHLPVSSTFSVDTRVLDVTERNEEIVAIQVELDKLNELYRPSLELQEEEIDFGEVQYQRPVTREIKLRNTGLVPATYSFRAPAPGKAICKPWFWPFPATAVIDKGKEATLTITCMVDEACTPELSLGEQMNDVLVFQVEGGKDSFISLQARFLPTLAGLSLDLPAVKDKLRFLSLDERRKLLNPPEESEWEDDTPKGKPPQEYWQLLEYLMSNGTTTDKLWTTPVPEDTILEWIEILDTSGILPPDEPYVAAETLLYLISTLPGHLVPESERAACKKVTNRAEAYGVVEKLSGVHANVLIGLMSVVRLCFGDAVPDDKTIEALAWAIFGGAPAGREKFVRGLLEL